jgi:anti-anti-sigma factor
MAIITSKDVSSALRVVTVSGRLDLQGTEKVEQSFLAVTRTGKQNIVVDLAEVTFLSSVGIRMLIASGKALKETGGRMVLVVGVNAAAIKTLKVTCVDAILPMFETFAAAEAELKS